MDRSPLLNRFLSRSSSSNPTPAQPYSSPSTGSQGPSPTGATLPNSDQHFKRFSPSQRPSLGQNDFIRHQATAFTPQEVKVDGRPVSFSTDAPLENPLDWAATSSVSRSARYDPIFLFPPKPPFKMSASTSAATSSGSRSRTTSTQSRAEYDPSLSSEEPRSEYTHSGRGEKKRPGWMSQVKNWLATNEPSAQAMKDQKRDAFKKRGIDFKDPQAAAKMHSPLGKVPIDAVTSTSGPTPEKALKEKVRVKDRPASCARHSRGSQSVSSSFSSLPSVKSGKGSNTITPWAEEG